MKKSIGVSPNIETFFGPRDENVRLLEDSLNISIDLRSNSIDLEGAPVCRLAPTPENFLWHTWWHFSTQFFTQFLAVMGFTTSEPTTHQQFHRGRAHTLFTLLAWRK